MRRGSGVNFFAHMEAKSLQYKPSFLFGALFCSSLFQLSLPGYRKCSLSCTHRTGTRHGCTKTHTLFHGKLLCAFELISFYLLALRFDYKVWRSARHRATTTLKGIPEALRWILTDQILYPQVKRKHSFPVQSFISKNMREVFIQNA